MAKKELSPRQSFTKDMEELFKLQILHGADYIDSRSRGAFRTWVKNRMKKLQFDVFSKSVWTDMKGNIVKGK